MTDEVVIITGAATGLGCATVFKLAEQNYKIAVVDFNEIDGQQTVEDVKAGQKHLLRRCRT